MFMNDKKNFFGVKIRDMDRDEPVFGPMFMMYAKRS